MELDIWIPHHSLAFEYQGEQHYHTLSFTSPTNALSEYTRRDKVKEATCERMGVKLIVVPYWWDQTSISLRELIEEEYQNLELL